MKLHEDQPSYIHWVKTSEYLEEFVDEINKILVAMGATISEKAELASYKLKDVAKTWCTIWKDI